MRIQVQKWGNSLAIRIPKSFAKETRIDQGSFVDLSTVEGKLIAEPITEEEYSLEKIPERGDVIWISLNLQAGLLDPLLRI